ncbi:PREDICTED: uncharacterized protein LOC104608757 isoform X2 [Nelumbo nucifera]|uniref:Uncharacterized protein LOC104608757 isoform X2 n=1 Tax=Nelumbo nucifera TaxID=4432 RepID=A0A1U8BAJ3_NELNU|nr:PREDICTED: uncharacterized protein LOC104608757 isoform X2 [Nelumbo nucifera]
MWVEVICGLVIYRLLRRFFHDDDDFEIEATDSDAKFLVASRIEKLYGGKVYLGLRIPDAETGSRQNVDMVLLTKGEAVVVSVKNFSGFVGIDDDGSWVCTSENKHKTERHPDPVLETKRQVTVLESYLEQRGVTLPEGYLSVKVVLPNRNCRLELKNNKHLFGEFLEFKGKQDDIQALRNIKRSKVSQLIIQKFSMLGLAHSKLQVLYSPRDFRNDGASVSEWKEVTVRSNTEVLFQPQNSNKVRKFKLSSIISMSLSA